MSAFLLAPALCTHLTKSDHNADGMQVDGQAQGASHAFLYCSSYTQPDTDDKEIYCRIEGYIAILQSIFYR